MKYTLLTLAAVLALSSSAFAANSTHPVKEHTPICVDAKTHVELDCAPTGSLKKERAVQRPAESKEPRLGISIDPWILPSTF
ncbi:DUF680 domain-containing protein [Mesorhizobium sp. ES1-1]|uniref:DUF680 domain-containing protein n=1 Tax=Mesorhizobium sp. ES1-1 TaxID=2876629 RepID=UPI001CD00D65|nr:DUF680 domain-containing protein [Mesorhizobium sp. ES1-1]MBZ9677467.1 DUF680 domain-containing protein [Mesorhizobium sp. ES1-1]